MDYFDELEQKNKEELEEKKYQELYQKQIKTLKVTFLIVFGILGFIFLLLGIIFLITQEEDPELLPIGIVFTCMGVVYLLLAILFHFCLPKKGNYEKYKKRINRYGGINLFNMNLKVELLEERVSKLEEENDDLKRQIKILSLERKQ